MNYASILKADLANGKGFRVSLFVSGCARKCPGCFNVKAQDPAFGLFFDEKAKQKIFTELEEPWCRGLSILGGEPLSVLSDNRKQVIAFAKEVKNRFPDKDIWLWTGYTLDEIINANDACNILNYIDVLIDGPFIENMKDLTTPFRGSTNQRIIDIVEWRKTGKINEPAKN